MLFLLVAPLLPLAGVAAAYGPLVDPAYELALAAPLGSLRLLLLRAVAVVAVDDAARRWPRALALPGLDWTAAAWLLPSLGAHAARPSALATAIGPGRVAARSSRSRGSSSCSAPGRRRAIR